MTIEEIKIQCKRLHIPTVYNVIVEQEAIPESNQLSFIDRIGLIFERELVDRQNKLDKKKQAIFYILFKI